MKIKFIINSLLVTMNVLITQSLQAFEQEINLKNLPNDAFVLVCSKLDAKSCIRLSLTNKSLYLSVKSVIEEHPDGVKMNDGSYLFLYQACKLDRFVEINKIENLAERLEASTELRGALLASTLRFGQMILANVALPPSAKNEERDIFHKKLTSTGLLLGVSMGETPAQCLANALVSREIWRQVRDQVHSQISDQLEDIVGSDSHNEIWEIIDNRVDAIVLGENRSLNWNVNGNQILEALSDEIWKSVWDQNRQQVGMKLWHVLGDHLERYFDFRKSIRENRIESDLDQAIDHSFFVLQIGAFLMLHSPEFSKICLDVDKRVRAAIQEHHTFESSLSIETSATDSLRIVSFLKISKLRNCNLI